MHDIIFIPFAVFGITAGLGVVISALAGQPVPLGPVRPAARTGFHPRVIEGGQAAKRWPDARQFASTGNHVTLGLRRG